MHFQWFKHTSHEAESGEQGAERISTI